MKSLFKCISEHLWILKVFLCFVLVFFFLFSFFFINISLLNVLHVVNVLGSISFKLNFLWYLSPKLSKFTSFSPTHMTYKHYLKSNLKYHSKNKIHFPNLAKQKFRTLGTFEFQINNNDILVQACSEYCPGPTYTKNKRRFLSKMHIWMRISNFSSLL